MLARRRSPSRLIALAPLVDVFLILLIFFMVTSTFLDLDMIPAVSSDEAPGAPTETPAATPALIRLGADDQPVFRGRAVALAELTAMLAADPAGLDRPILILPSARASMQALVSVIDGLTLAGAASVQVVQLEALP